MLKQHKLLSVKSIRVHQRERFLASVSGKIFHVTNTKNIASILADGGLSPNSSLEYESMFGSRSNGFFRLKNCVSFFDYRDYRSKKWDEFAYKCFPTKGVDKYNSAAILFLCENQHSKLISWDIWKKEEAYAQSILPHIEMGYPGKVSLEHIEEVIMVSE